MKKKALSEFDRGYEQGRFDMLMEVYFMVLRMMDDDNGRRSKKW